MEDYSDKTLRALIRQLIMEDRPNRATGPEEGQNRKANFFSLARRSLSYLFSPAGVVALIAAGFIFEKDFTIDTLKLGIDTGKNSIEAINAFNDSKNKGNIFLRLSEAAAAFNDAQKESKYKYLARLREYKDKSFTADIVYKLMTDASEEFGIKDADKSKVSKADAEIIAAVLNGQSLKDLFTKELFVVTPKNEFKTSESSKIPMNAADLKKASDESSARGKHIDSQIYLAMSNSMEFAAKGETEQANAEMNNAYRVYAAAIELSGVPDDELQQMTLLGNLDDIEGGLTSNFERTIATVEKKASGAFKDALKKAKNIIRGTDAEEEEE